MEWEVSHVIASTELIGRMEQCRSAQLSKWNLERSFRWMSRCVWRGSSPDISGSQDVRGCPWPCDQPFDGASVHSPFTARLGAASRYGGPSAHAVASVYQSVRSVLVPRYGPAVPVARSNVPAASSRWAPSKCSIRHGSSNTEPFSNDASEWLVVALAADMADDMPSWCWFLLVPIPNGTA